MMDFIHESTHGGSQHQLDPSLPFTETLHDFSMSTGISQSLRTADISSFKSLLASQSFNLSRPDAGSFQRTTLNPQDSQIFLDIGYPDITSTLQTVSGPALKIMTPHEVPSVFCFSKLMIQTFTRIFLHSEPFPQSLSRSYEVSSQRVMENMYSRDTVEVLRKQSVDHQIFHMVVHRLINDEYAISALRHPSSDKEKLFKAGVEHMFSYESRAIGHFIDSNPQPYKDALEHGMFRAAIELGSVHVLDMLLSRGYNARTTITFGHLRVYPLGRSFAHFDLETTRFLLERGALPEQFDWEEFLGNPKDRMLNVTSQDNINVDIFIDIIRLLLSYGIKMCSNAAHYIFQHGDLELVLATSNDPYDHSYKFVVTSGLLAKALRYPDTCPSLQPKIQVILEHEYPYDVRDRQDWDENLTLSLSRAASYGLMGTVTVLLAAGAQPNTDCLVNATHSKSIMVFQRFLHLGLDPNALSSYDVDEPWDHEGAPPSLSNSRTALSVCIEERFKEGFELLDKGGYLTEVGHNSYSLGIALAAACKIGNLGLVKRLLSLRKDSNHYHLLDAVSAAIESGRDNIFEYLIRNGAIPGRTSLYLAVKQRNESLTSLLLQILTYPDDKFHKENGILCEAIRWGNIDLIRCLIRAGISIDCLEIIRNGDEDRELPIHPLNTNWKVSPLSLAILRGQQEVVSLLLSSGAQLNVQHTYMHHENERYEREAISAVTASVIRKDYELCQQLLRRGADPLDNLAIYMASSIGSEDIIKVLLEAFQRRNPSGRRSFASAALFRAVYDEQWQLVQLLIPFVDLQESIFTWDQRFRYAPYHGRPGTSIMSLSIDMSARGKHRLLKILLRHGVDLNCIITDGFHGHITPLLLAIRSGSLETVSTLVESGADASLAALWGLRRTPLQAAAEAGHVDIVEYFLKKKVNLNEPPAPRAGATAFQLAAIQGFIGIAATLLDKGANVNARPALLDGRTAFEGATEHGRIEMMLYLVQNGADLHADDQQQFRRAVKFAEDNAQHAARKVAQELFKATRKDGSIQVTAQESAEALIPDLDVSEGLFSSFAEFSPFMEQGIAEAIIPNLDVSESLFPSFVGVSPFPEQEDTEPNLMDLDEHDDFFPSLVNLSPGPSVGWRLE
jgi:ankyrin repeat protein